MENVASSEIAEPVLRARVAGRTDTGRRRSENQDHFLISDLAPGENALVLRPATGAASGGTLSIGLKGALLLVADGMGGAAAGRLASGLACSFVLAELQEGWQQDRNHTPRQFALRLREAVEKASGRIHEHAGRHPECMGMGTTATAAGLLDGIVYLAHVGDSRAYLVRAGAATQLTRDQSYVQQMIDVGAMTEEEAERSSQGSVILQALGVEAHVAVDLTYQVLRRGDLLLLCSDGLHRVVRAEEIAARAGLIDAAEPLCDELIALANERGGPDNITVVAARLDGEALPDSRPDDVVSRTPYAFDEGDIAP
ncbi:MAG TPA: protein phosphatase 2C domain-containing protein [Longimicrobiales bacterium]|nr:protein phosphatase 2C domain-containing protein [Longimicrobiales bacterium]